MVLLTTLLVLWKNQTSS